MEVDAAELEEVDPRELEDELPLVEEAAVVKEGTPGTGPDQLIGNDSLSPPVARTALIRVFCPLLLHQVQFSQFEMMNEDLQ